MKNKSGMLLPEETVKIIISLIAIVFLAFFLASIYFSKVSGDNIRKAEQALIKSSNSMEKVIANLKEGESTKFSLDKYGSLGDSWNLFGFIADPKPNQCSVNKCLCICDDVLSSDFQNQAKECSKQGICIPVTNLKNEINTPLDEILNEIFLKKENGEILISDKIIDSTESARIKKEAETPKQEEESIISVTTNFIKSIWSSIFGGGKTTTGESIPTGVKGKGANPAEVGGETT